MQLIRVWVYIMTLSLLSGCTSTTVLNSELIGACLRTASSTYIYKSYCTAATGQYLLSTRTNDGGNPCIRGAAEYLLPPDIDLQINRVMKQGRGSTGDCLRIEVSILSGENKGLIADIPVCGLLHPSPFWITQGFDAESEILFDENFATLALCTK
ncbi:hypothetical protein QE250_16680 [Chromatiaceae bacterium AAb-1]|nr:hypothetical protein [Chromatiaceae bacterium AAb-1]